MHLPVTPFENNPQRVTKKSALGLLARVYAQGGGENLSEGGKSYWLRAKEVADTASLIIKLPMALPCMMILQKYSPASQQ